MKKLYVNVISLFLMQGINYLIPFVLIPFLILKLDISGYGDISFFISIMIFFSVFVDYGFNITATKKISQKREFPNKIKIIYVNVISIKIFILFVFFVLGFGGVLFFGENKDIYLFFLVSPYLIGQTIFPLWFFQGVEDLYLVALVSSISKILGALLVFVFVKEIGDLYIAAFLMSLPNFISGVFGYILASKKIKPDYRRVNLKLISFYIREGFYVFASNVSISFYTTFSTIILGVFSSSQAVGVYSAAEKIIQAIKGIIQPISQSVYPFIVKLLSVDRKKASIFIYKNSLVTILPMLFLSFVIFFFSDIISLYLSKKDFESISKIVQVMSPIPFFVSISNVIGIQVMLSHGYNKLFMNITVYSALLAVFFSLIFVPIYKEMATAYIVFGIEFLISLMMIFWFFRFWVKGNE